ncbi:MAG: sigma-70 family RNA polymerase sigma factor [bacterium]|nr:sigma-70 family RNA polymerase sigma factor [bacterium]
MIDAAERAYLQAARAGDYEAYEALHDRLAPAIGRFVRRLIGDTPEAEDVVQDTLIALYMHLPRLDPPEKLRPFLYRVARNQCYDVLRRQGRWETVSTDLDEDDPLAVRIAFDIASAAAEPSPEDATHWLLMLMEVKAAMERLPELQRQTLILYCEEDFSYAEIAETMDVSIGTVKSRLFHAKRGLRGLIPPRTLAAIEDELGLWMDEQGEDDHDQRGNRRETDPVPERAASAGAFDGTVAARRTDGRDGRAGRARVHRAAR